MWIGNEKYKGIIHSFNNNDKYYNNIIYLTKNEKYNLLKNKKIIRKNKMLNINISVLKKKFGI
jgi:hypothetical protein